MKQLMAVLCICLVLQIGMVGVCDSLQAPENLRQKAEQAIEAEYPFCSELYDCTVQFTQKDAQLLFCLKQSEKIIYEVIISADSNCCVIYHDDYSLDDYWDDLIRQRGQHFAFWSVEDKYWFASILPELVHLQTFRDTHDHPEWLPHISKFVYGIKAHTYSLPKENELSEEQAIRIARDAAVRTGEIVPSVLINARTASYFYRDEDVAQWRIGFFSSETANPIGTIWVNAISGEACYMLEEKAITLAREALIASGKVQEFHVARRSFDAHYYGGSTPFWQIVNLTEAPAVQMEVTVNDQTGDANVVKAIVP